MKTPFTLGVVGHFGLAVRAPKKSAKWFENLGHMSFHRPKMTALRKALATSRDARWENLKIRPMRSARKRAAQNTWLSFRDPDGYRWELRVRDGKKQ